MYRSLSMIMLNAAGISISSDNPRKSGHILSISSYKLNRDLAIRKNYQGDLRIRYHFLKDEIGNKHMYRFSKYMSAMLQ